jgi:hypothetical protein
MTDRRSPNHSMTVPIDSVTVSRKTARPTVEIVVHALIALAVVIGATILGAFRVLDSAAVVGAWTLALGTSGTVTVVRRNGHGDHG